MSLYDVTKIKKISDFRKKLFYDVTGPKMTKIEKFKENLKECLETLLLTIFHINIPFFEENRAFSIFSKFVLAHGGNCYFSPTSLDKFFITQELNHVSTQNLCQIRAIYKY